MTVFRIVAPSLKVILPPGTPEPFTVGATVAVNVTASPACEGFLELVRLTRVPAVFNKIVIVLAV